MADDIQYPTSLKRTIEHLSVAYQSLGQNMERLSAFDNALQASTTIKINRDATIRQVSQDLEKRCYEIDVYGLTPNFSLD